jgi:RNase P/RNase MRP subunit p29
MTNRSMTIEGKVFEILQSSEKMWEVVLRKKHKEKIVPISFLAFVFTINDVKRLNIKPKDRVKIQFHLRSKMYGNRYYTSAVIDKIDILQRDAGTPNMFHTDVASMPFGDVDMETGEIF